MINGFIHRSNCAREVTSPRHPCAAQHSWHTWNKELKTEKVPLKIKDYIQRRIQSKRLHTRQSLWETQTTTTTS